MKKILLTAIITLIGIHTATAQVGIGTETPAASAQLELQSTTKGFLPPRMTTKNRDDIENPVEGLTIYNTDDNCLNIYVGFGWRNLCEEVGPNDVINPKTGQIWMDRNLGASQVATSSTDYLAYGDLYQWGRGADGHQIRTSGTTATNATTAVPNSVNSWDGLFITEGSSPFDWLTPQPQDNNLWQGVNGVNNPCPSGYRLPTEAELDAERSSWDTNNAAGAFGSPLKLPMAGYRFLSDGSLFNVGTFGLYWSSTVIGANSRGLYFRSSIASMITYYRANGGSVRCLKD